MTSDGTRISIPLEILRVLSDTLKNESTEACALIVSCLDALDKFVDCYCALDAGPIDEPYASKQLIPWKLDELAEEARASVYEADLLPWIQKTQKRALEADIAQAEPMPPLIPV